MRSCRLQERGRCAFVVAFLLASVVLVAARAQARAQGGVQGSVSSVTAGGDLTEGARAADGVLGILRQDPAARDGALATRESLMRAGFDAFIERMDAFDGPRSVAIARELFAEAPAIWSAFCLEGALRRSAPGDAGQEAPNFQAAYSALEGLLDAYTDAPQAQLELTQRIAILALGFQASAHEKSALGRALAARGADAAQISGMAALGRNSDAAARLFGSLLDRARVMALAPLHVSAPRQDDESVTAGGAIDPISATLPQPEVAAWALRGHALATLELLRGPSSIQD